MKCVGFIEACMDIGRCPLESKVTSFYFAVKKAYWNLSKRLYKEDYMLFQCLPVVILVCYWEAPMMDLGYHIRESID